MNCVGVTVGHPRLEDRRAASRSGVAVRRRPELAGTASRHVVAVRHQQPIEDGLAAGGGHRIGPQADEADRCVARDYFTRHVGAALRRYRAISRLGWEVRWEEVGGIMMVRLLVATLVCVGSGGHALAGTPKAMPPFSARTMRLRFGSFRPRLRRERPGAGRSRIAVPSGSWRG